MTASDANFEQIIESDLAQVDALIKLLEQEKEHLANRRFEELAPLIEQKQQKMRELEVNFKQRIEFLTTNYPGNNYLECLDNYISNLEPHKREPINQLNQSLEQQLAKCRDLNTINGQVISVNLHNHSQLMNLIQGKSNQTTYDATGNLRHQQAQNKHQEI